MIQLYDYQQECADSVINFLMSMAGHPIAIVPTGGGKSVIQAELVDRLTKQYPIKVMCLTHVKELIEQNYLAYINYRGGQAGIYQAALKRRDTLDQVIFAGIQSVAKKHELFGIVDLCIIDEAHLIPKKGNGLYRQFLDGLLSVNPNMKIVGLTASPWRLDSGSLLDGDDRIFTDIAYNIPLTTLLEKEKLCRLVSKQGDQNIDLTGVHTRAGEYVLSELEGQAMAITQAAVGEIIAYGLQQNRKAWLLFAVSVKHAHVITEQLRTSGIAADVVTGALSQKERNSIISRFKSGELRALVNCDVLTTGFDHKAIDLVAMLRATQSAALYYQILGRGMRVHPDKQDCLVLDYGSNIIRHGCVDELVERELAKGGKKKGKKKGEPIAKSCPGCNTVVMIQTMECPDCGHKWERNPASNLEGSASTQAIMSIDKPAQEWLQVHKVSYRRHSKPGKPDSVKVTYFCNGFSDFVNDWLCFDHSGHAKALANFFLHSSAQKPIPDEITTDSMLEYAQNDGFKVPTAICVDRRGKYPKILERRYSEPEVA